MNRTFVARRKSRVVAAKIEWVTEWKMKWGNLKSQVFGTILPTGLANCDNKAFQQGFKMTGLYLQGVSMLHRRSCTSHGELAFVTAVSTSVTQTENDLKVAFLTRDLSWQKCTRKEHKRQRTKCQKYDDDCPVWLTQLHFRVSEWPLREQFSWFHIWLSSLSGRWCQISLKNYGRRKRKEAYFATTSAIVVVNFFHFRTVFAHKADPEKIKMKNHASSIMKQGFYPVW